MNSIASFLDRLRLKPSVRTSSFYANAKKTTKRHIARHEGFIKCGNEYRKGILYVMVHKNKTREIFFPNEHKEREFIFSQNFVPVLIAKEKFRNILSEIRSYMLSTPNLYYINISNKIHDKVLDISEDVYSLYSMEKSIRKLKDFKNLDDTKFEMYCFECIGKSERPYANHLYNTLILAVDENDAIRLATKIFKGTVIQHASYIIDIKRIPKEKRVYYKTGLEELLLKHKQIDALKSSIFDPNIFRVISEFV